MKISVQLTGNITSTAWISILPPCPSNAIVLFIYLEVYIPQPLWDPDPKIYARITGTYYSDFQRAKVFNWLVFYGERGAYGPHLNDLMKQSLDRT